MNRLRRVARPAPPRAALAIAAAIAGLVASAAGGGGGAVARAAAPAAVTGGFIAGESPAPTLTGDAAEPVRTLVDRACALLLHNQERYEPDPPVGTLPPGELDGWQAKERARLEGLRARGSAREWPYEGVYRVPPDGRIPPGYRVGGSAIVCTALLEAPDLDEARRAAITRSAEFMLDAIEGDPGMRPQTQRSYDVRGWGHAYALMFFLRAVECGLFRDGPLTDRVQRAIPHLVQCLERGQVEEGGWNYAGRGASPFMTGAVLIALFRARAAGHEVDAEVVEHALELLERGRGERVAFAYSGALRNPDEPMQGACARSAIAELVLFRAGRSSVDRLRKSVDGFFEEENWRALLARKSKQGTHARPYGVAPYYFFFGHTYAALAAEHLPTTERARYRTAMRKLLARTMQENGGWNDRVFPRTESYSTAMAVLSLLAERRPPVPTWRREVSL